MKILGSGKNNSFFIMHLINFVCLPLISARKSILKGQQSTAVRDHMLDCNHVVNHDDFILMTRDNSDYLLQIKESLFIGRDDPSLNKTIKSVPLYLF